jgi:site-specific DNA recombinase
VIDRLGDLVASLRQADPHDKAEVYRHLGLYLSFDPNRQIVRAEARPGSWRGEMVRVGGATRPETQPHRSWSGVVTTAW